MTTTVLTSFVDARSALAARGLAARGLAGCRQLSESLDGALRSLADPVLRSGIVLVAIGGYGRREQYRHSEIELLFLGVDDAGATAPAVLQPLWDAGLRVRYEVRSVEDAMRAAHENVDVLISYLDARLICGNEDVYGGFIDSRQRLVRRSRGAIRDALARRHRALVASELWQLQEPDLATSRGGLDELQALHWIELADAIANRRGQRPPGDPGGPLAAQHELLAQVRAALHALDDEPNDRWRVPEATAVAELLGVDPTILGRQLLIAMREVDEVVARTVGAPQESSWMRWGRRLLPPTPAERPSARVTDTERLLALLRVVGTDALEPLPRTDWLDRVLPEWEALRARLHSAPFHQHPVDVHAVRTVIEARRATVEDAEGMGTTAVSQDVDPDELLLAALVHELGQVSPEADERAGAILVERFASRVGLDAEAAQRLTNVTALQSLLPTVASRRDISEPRVIEEVAEAVGDPATLHLLYLVTVADARATGPAGWNAWKAALTRTLYVRVLEHLRAGAPEMASATALRHEAALAALEGRFSRGVIDAHLQALPPRYLLAIRPETIGEHLALIDEVAGGTVTRHDRAGGMERLTIVTHDRPGILSLVAGALAVNDISVLGGSAYTRDDGVAIEILHVEDALGGAIDETRWSRTCDDIPLALAGEFRIDERLLAARQARPQVDRSNRATTVHVDNSGPEGYSVIEVAAADRVGLLYAITRVLRDLRLDIHLAKVDTFGHEVADAFYVLRENGQKIEAPDEIDRVQRRIVEAITVLDY
ncbi:MAG: hypothetical protein WCQ48_00485 [Chloroflexota bacterium]